jgi:hypothetical protein
MSTGRVSVRWCRLLVAAIVFSAGCRAYHGNFPLPDGKAVHDDVQYFPPGPPARQSKELAAQQRARLRQMGMDVDEPAPTAGDSKISPAETSSPR